MCARGSFNYKILRYYAIIHKFSTKLFRLLIKRCIELIHSFEITKDIIIQI